MNMLLINYNRDEALKLVKENGYNLKFIDSTYQTDREIVLEAVKSNANAYKCIKYFKNDPEIIKETIANCRTLLFSKFFPEWIHKDKEIMLHAVKHNSHSAKMFDKTLFEDVKFITECLKLSPESIKWLPKTIEFPEIVYLTVINSRHDLLIYVPERLMNNENFIIQCIKGNYKSAFAIQPKYYTLNSLKLAVVENPSIIQSYPRFASLFDDARIVPLSGIDTKINLKIFIECIKINVQCYKFLPNLYKKNSEVINTVLDYDGNAILYINPSLYNDELICRAITSIPTVLKRLNKKLLTYKIVLHAVSLNAHTIKYAPEYAKHAEIFDAMIKNDITAIAHLDNSILLMHATLIHNLCMKDGNYSYNLACKVFVPQILNNVALVIKLAEQNLYILSLCSDDILNNSYLRKKMLKINPMSDLLFAHNIN